jgi:4-hydroxythreonine-4-phosphate dehydrogenase
VKKKIKIGITLGDPKGVGSEVTEKALRSFASNPDLEFSIYGDNKIFSTWQHDLGAQLITPFPSPPLWTEISCGHASMAYLETAVQDALSKKIDAVVTAPICKANLQKAGYPYPGHTEFLAEKTGSSNVVMMMASPGLKVTLVTIHVPLKNVPNLITPEKIQNTVRITYRGLKEFWGLTSPRVAVCGLNPHAGEEGMLGDEEIHIIQPALEVLRNEGYSVLGPLVPDAVFHQAHEGKFDAVVCMYHDQGLIPFKMLHFRDGVNVTLGLPIIRTSPDHGVAYDIAGKGIADPSSMRAAIDLAIQVTQKRNSV